MPRVATLGISRLMGDAIEAHVRAQLDRTLEVLPQEKCQGEFSAALIGPDDTDPVAAARLFHALNPDAPVIILRARHLCEELSQKLELTPDITRDTQVLAADSLDEHMQPLVEAAERGRRRMNRRGSTVSTEDLNRQMTSGHHRQPLSMSALMENLPVGVILISPTERILTMNPAARMITGLERCSAGLTPWFCWVPGAQVDSARKFANGQLSEQETLRIELSVDSKSVRHIELRRATISGSRRCILILSDVTERVLGETAIREKDRILRQSNRLLKEKVAERIGELQAKSREIQRLYGVEQAEQAKARFISTMSHEIRTPLHNIIGLIGLADRATGDPTTRRYLDMMKGSAEVLQNVVDDILDFSRLESGMVQLDPQPFDFGHMLESTANAVAGSAAAKNLRLIVFADPRIDSCLSGDEKRIQQIVLNLAGNAVKFTEQGSVAIEARVTEADSSQCTLEVKVADSGIGIDAEVKGSIFEVFTQAESGTARRFGGSGLGLAICRSLAELMRGRIDVDSTPGRGSTFRFVLTLPRAILKPKLPDFRLDGLRVDLDAADRREQDYLSAYIEAAGGVIDTNAPIQLLAWDEEAVLIKSRDTGQTVAELNRPLTRAMLLREISSAAAGSAAGDAA